MSERWMCNGCGVVIDHTILPHISRRGLLYCSKCAWKYGVGFIGEIKRERKRLREARERDKLKDEGLKEKK